MANIMDEIKGFFNAATTDKGEAMKAVEVEPLVNTHVFVDFDNISWAELGTVELDERACISFYAAKPHDTMIGSANFIKATKNCTAKINTVIAEQGPNSTDFHIICDVGQVAAIPTTEAIYVISNDKGYDSALDRLRNQTADRIKTIERFSTMKECILDMKLKSASTSEEVKEVIVDLLGGKNSRKGKAALEKLNRLEKGVFSDA